MKPDSTPARPPRSYVDCLYSVVHSDAGTKLLRLATLGSDQRKMHPKPSQIIEVDEAMARELIDVLHDTFPTLRP